jgi:hypothetical protein
MELKKEIEQLYINALYNDEAPNNFASKMLELIGEDKSREQRTSPQNAARWKYLSMVASVLNDKGFTHEAKGIDIPIKWNKDILYQIYWQSSRGILFPEKKRQLNTKEFSELVEHIKNLFAMVFDIHLPFPNMADKTRKE